MARQIWGCYAVADHKEPRAFVADVLLYERLVVPVPPPDDPQELNRWERRRWDPKRQAELLKILGSVAETVPWSARRRAKWAIRWKSASAAVDLGHVADAARSAELTGVSPQAAHITREVLSDELTAKVL